MTYHNPLVTCSFYISPGISSYGVTSPQKAHGVFLEIEAAPSSGIPSELKSNPKPLQWPGRLHPVTLSPTPRVSRNSPFSSSSTLSPFLPELNSALFARPHPPSFPMRMRTADSLASSRSLLRLHLKRAMAADSLEQAEDHSVSFHGFITLFVLCCCLGPYPFVCLLALSLPPGECKLEGRDFLFCLLLCLQRLIDCWCLCVKGKWPSCTGTGRLEQCLCGKTHGDWSNNKSPVAHCIAGHCTEI